MRRAWHAAAAYLALTIVATWPLAGGLGRDVPADLGDPVFVMWALAWDCQQLLAILRGDFARLATFFDANIFHPLPLTLAYSEHFIAQAVQVLPVWVLTGNPILCYNLLYLSTFVLSGLGRICSSVRSPAIRAPRLSPACSSRLLPTGFHKARICRCCRLSGCRSRCTDSAGSSTHSMHRHRAEDDGGRYLAQPQRSSRRTYPAPTT